MANHREEIFEKAFLAIVQGTAEKVSASAAISGSSSQADEIFENWVARVDRMAEVVTKRLIDGRERRLEEVERRPVDWEAGP